MSNFVISQPDTTTISTRVVELKDYLVLKITSLEGMRAAKAGLDAVEEQRRAVKELFKDAKDKAEAAYNSVASLERSFLDPLSSIDKYLREEVMRFGKAQEEAAQELKKALEEDKDPWDIGYTNTTDYPLAPVVTKIPGLGVRKKPARAVVVDKRALILAAAEGLKKGENGWLDDLEANEASLSAKARQWGREQFEEKRPGCKWTQDKTVARK